MRSLQILNNQKGLTLMGVIIATALSGILVMSIATGITQVQKAQTSVDVASRSRTIVDEVKIALESSDLCDSAMINLNYVPSGEVSLSGIVLTANGIPTAFEDNKDIAPGLKLVSISLVTNMSGAQGEPITLSESGVAKTYYRYVGAIRLRLERTMGVVQSVPDIFIPINFIGSHQGSGTIKACGKSILPQKMCASLNYLWDDSTKTCKPANECTYGGSYGEGPTGQGYDNPLTKARSCPTGYTARRSGSMMYSTACGKACVSNQVHPTYECVRCLDASGNVYPPTMPPALPAYATGFNADPDYQEGLGAYGQATGQVNVNNSYLTTTTTVTTTTLPPPTTTMPGAGCSSQALSWTDSSTGLTCTKSSGVGVNGQSISLSISNQSLLGLGNFLCQNGAWVDQGSSCKYGGGGGGGSGGGGGGSGGGGKNGGGGGSNTKKI